MTLSRSEIMSRITGDNLKPERTMHAALRSAGLRPQRNCKDLPGSPDFVWRRRKTALFVDGCYWHCCPKHCSVPKTNTARWVSKFAKNRKRDRRNNRELREAGWTVYRLWECTVKKQPVILARSVRTALKSRTGVSADSFLLNYARSSPTAFIRMFSHR